MKKPLMIAGIALTMLCGAQAQAADLQFGLTGGLTDYDVPNSDAGISGIFTLGHEFHRSRNIRVAVEGELSLPLLDTEVNNNDFGFESLGAFAALRTTGPVYFIGRAGMVHGEIESASDTEPALGLGVGFTSGGFKWEVGYTAYEVDNVDVDILSVGLRF